MLCLNDKFSIIFPSIKQFVVLMEHLINSNQIILIFDIIEFFKGCIVLLIEEIILNLI